MTNLRLFVVLAVLAGCSGRSGVEVVGDGGPVADSGSETGSAGATDGGLDAPAEGAPATPACIDSCTTALSIGCPSDEMNECLLGCGDVRTQFPACAAEFDAENACAAAEPESSWFCDADGFATLDKSFCTAEIAAFETCLHDNYG